MDFQKTLLLLISVSLMASVAAAEYEDPEVTSITVEPYFDEAVEGDRFSAGVVAEHNIPEEEIESVTAQYWFGFTNHDDKDTEWTRESVDHYNSTHIEDFTPAPLINQRDNDDHPEDRFGEEIYLREDWKGKMMNYQVVPCINTVDGDSYCRTSTIFFTFAEGDWSIEPAEPTSSEDQVDRNIGTAIIDTNLGYSFETDRDGTLTLFVNGEEKRTHSVSEGANNFETTLGLEPGMYDWHLEFESDDGQKYEEEEDTEDFEVESPLIDVQELKPEDEITRLNPDNNEEKIEWVIDAEDLDSGEEFETEIILENENGEEVLQVTETYSGGQTIEEDTGIEDLDLGEYETHLKAYQDDELKADVTQEFEVVLAEYFYEDAKILEDTLEIEMETDYEVTEKTFAVYYGDSSVYSETFSTSPDEVDDHQYLYNLETDVSGQLAQGEVHTVVLEEVVSEGETVAIDREIDLVLDSVDTDADFEFTGEQQVYTVPDGVQAIEVELFGAAGEHSGDRFGEAGFTRAQLDVEPGMELYIYVGGSGENSSWNGGGIAEGSNAGSGGGATDIRLHNPELLQSRLLVAGGSGGYSDRWGDLYIGGGGNTEESEYLLGYGENASSTRTGAGGGGYYGGQASSYGGAGGSGYAVEEHSSSAEIHQGINPVYGDGWVNIQEIDGSEVEDAETLPEEPSIELQDVPENTDELGFNISVDSYADGDVEVKIYDEELESRETVFSDSFSHSEGEETYSYSPDASILSGNHTIEAVFNGVSADSDSESFMYDKVSEGDVNLIYEPIHEGEEYGVCYNPQGEAPSDTMTAELGDSWSVTKNFTDTTDLPHPNRNYGDYYCFYPDHEHETTGPQGTIQIFNEERGLLMVEKDLETVERQEQDFDEYDREITLQSEETELEVPKQVFEIHYESWGAKGGGGSDGGQGGQTTGTLNSKDIFQLDIQAGSSGELETIEEDDTYIEYYSGGESSWIKINETEQGINEGEKIAIAGGGGGASLTGLSGGDGGGVKGGNGENLEEGAGRGGRWHTSEELGFRTESVYNGFTAPYNQSGTGGEGYNPGEIGAEGMPGGGGAAYCNEAKVEDCFISPGGRFEDFGEVSLAFNYAAYIEDMQIVFEEGTPHANFQVTTSIDKDYASAEEVQLEIVSDDTPIENNTLEIVEEDGDKDVWETQDTVELENTDLDYEFIVTSEASSGKTHKKEFNEMKILEAEGFFGHGYGTESEPYEIDNCINLHHLGNEEGFYELVNSIECSDTDFYEGTFGSVNISEVNLEGNNYTIAGVDRERNFEQEVGLIEKAENSEIRNINFERFKAAADLDNSESKAALILDSQDTHIENINLIESSIKAYHTAGTVADKQGGEITGLDFDENSTVESIKYGGAAVAQGDNTILDDIIVEGNVTSAVDISDNSIAIGGVAGELTNSQANRIGAKGFIQESYNVNEQHAAGLVRTLDNSSIEDAFFIGEIDSEGSGAIAEITGDQVSLNRVFIRPNETRENTEAGMIVANIDSGTDIHISNSYSAYGLTYPEGDSSPSYDDWESVYYNEDHTDEGAYLEGATPKTTEELQTESELGFDFEDNWARIDGRNEGYPFQQVFEFFYPPPEINDITHPEDVDETIDFQVSADTEHPIGSEMTHTWHLVKEEGERVELGEGQNTEISVPENNTGPQMFELQVTDGIHTESENFFLTVACLEKEECKDIPSEIEMINPVNDTIPNEPVYFEFEFTGNDGTIGLYEDYGDYGPTGLVETIEHDRGTEQYEIEHETPPEGENEWVVTYYRAADGSRYTSPRVPYEWVLEDNEPPEITSLDIPSTVDQGEEFEVSVSANSDYWEEDQLTYQWNYKERPSTTTLCYEEPGESEVITRVYDPYEHTEERTPIEVIETGDTECFEDDDDRDSSDPSDEDDPENETVEDSEEDEQQEPKTDIPTEIELMYPSHEAYFDTASSVSHGVDITANRGTVELIINGETVSSSSHSRGDQEHSFTFTDIEEETINAWKIRYTRTADGKEVESPTRQYYVENSPELGDGDEDVETSEDELDEGEEASREDGDVTGDGEIDYPSSNLAYYDDEEEDIVYNFTVNETTGTVDIYQGRSPELVDDGDPVFSGEKNEEGEVRFTHREDIEEEKGFFYYQVVYETDLGQEIYTDIYTVYADPGDLEIQLNRLDDRIDPGPVTYQFGVISEEAEIRLYENGELIFEEQKQTIGAQQYSIESETDDYGVWEWSVEVDETAGEEPESGSDTDSFRIVQDEEQLEDDTDPGDDEEDSADEDDPFDGDQPEDDEEDPFDFEDEDDIIDIEGEIRFENTDWSIPNGVEEERAFDIVNARTNNTLIYIQIPETEECEYFDFRGIDTYRDTTAYEVPSAESTSVPVRVDMPLDEEEISCEINADMDYNSTTFTITADNELSGVPELIQPVQANVQPLIGALLEEQRIEFCSNPTGNFAGQECEDPITLDIRPGTIIAGFFGLLAAGGFIIRFYRERYLGKPGTKSKSRGKGSSVEPE